MRKQRWLVYLCDGCHGEHLESRAVRTKEVWAYCWKSERSAKRTYLREDESPKQIERP